MSFFSLTITDNADGSGGLATINGSAGGATNTVWSAPFSGDMSALPTWTPLSSRSGDGTVNIPNTFQGSYVWLCLNTSSPPYVMSNMVYQNLTNQALNQPTAQILDAVQTKVKSLGLAGLSSVNVVEKWLPRFIANVDSFPCVMICPVNAENFPGILNNKDDIGVPILICILDAQGEDYTLNLKRNLNWRWKIRSAFRYQQLAGVPSVLNCYPEETPVFDKQAFEAGVFLSPIIMRFLTRTTRG